MSSYNKSRRKFIKNAGLVSAGFSSFGSSLFQLNFLGKIAGFNSAQTNDYKALICFYLDGGADSFNLLVPRGQTEYNEYAITRSNIALDRDELLPISPINISGVQYGLHPKMQFLQSVFNQGKACLISNTGTLVQHVTKLDYENGTGKFPLGLFSHSDQTNQWESASPSTRLTKGWGGRIADLLFDKNINQNYSMNVSFEGTNTFQSSVNQVEFTVNNDGAISLEGYDGMYDYLPQRRKAIDELLSYDYNNAFKDTYRKLFRHSIDTAIEFNSIIDKVPEFNTPIGNDYQSGKIRMLGKIIKARKELGFNRQIFFIRYGGWDTHDDLLENQNNLYGELDSLLSVLYNVLEEIDMLNNVVTFTMSDFGRTLTSNGNGTDHAWGGNHFAFGGPVKGNKLYGTFPSLVLDNSLDIGNGVLIPTTPNDLYFAELALWFGVSPNDLHYVFPNLYNFYSQGSTHAPIGFLNI